MERRKFLIGAAGTAIGGSALVGSGAFTSVQADRDVTVEVADDSDAFLRLAPSEDPNGYYAQEVDGQLEIDFTENEEVSESGINDRAFVSIESVVEVGNQGTQDIRVAVSPDDEELSGADVSFFLGRTGDPENGLYEGSILDEEQGMRFDNTDAYNAGDFPQISPGEALTFGFSFNQSSESDFGSIIDSLDSITVHAGTAEQLETRR